MDRFFIEQDQIQGSNIIIEGPDVKHITGALRLDIGSEIEVVSNGMVYNCRIGKLVNKQVHLDILSSYKGVNEPRIKINLYQGLAKGSKMDYIIQKGTEVGISNFYGVEMDRSVVRVAEGKKKESKLIRWQKIADEAGKQSKRDILPRVGGIISFKDLILRLEKEKNILIPYEKEGDNRISKVLKECDGTDINIIIGPEGGFSEDEILLLKDIGGKTLSLGPRILRTETAGLLTAGIIFYEFGDI